MQLHCIETMACPPPHTHTYVDMCVCMLVQYTPAVIAAAHVGLRHCTRKPVSFTYVVRTTTDMHGHA